MIISVDMFRVGVVKIICVMCSLDLIFIFASIWSRLICVLILLKYFYVWISLGYVVLFFC